MAAGAAAAPTPQERVLEAAEACDLDLVLAGVLPHGSVLGRPHERLAAPPVGVGPSVPWLAVQTGDASATTGSLLLRDAEHTPVARLDPVESRTGAAGPVLVGAAHALRRRESGPLPDLRADLTDGRHRDRPLLLLLRPPVAQDEPGLQAWAAAAGSGALVLVPEGGTLRHHLPAEVGWALAEDLTARLGLVEPEIAVAPLLLRDAATDRVLLDGLLARHAGRALVLADDPPSPAAAAWREAAQRLVHGVDGTPLPGVAEDVERRLRRWWPPRGERGLVVLFTGLSGSGKSTVARDLDRYLRLRTDRSVTLLDGDVVRRMLSSGLGFDRASREMNVRRIGWVAARVAEHGGTAVCSPIAPFASTRADVRTMVEQVADLVLVHVSTPLEECERRDLKGLYARARRGEIPDFTGISSPYEEPQDADVVVDTSVSSRAESLAAVVTHLRDAGWIT